MNKKLLIVTQKVDKNDPILGFFHRWLEEFAKNFESVIVICLHEGKHELPANVRVLTLGKEKSISKTKFVKNFRRYIRAELDNYDAVLVHMNPIYVVLGGLFWKKHNKPVSLWYTHRKVDLKLRIAAYFAKNIFTASKESFNLVSPKLLVVGHGIDTEHYGSAQRVKELGKELVKIVHIGRITPIKGCDVLIKAAAKLKKTLNKKFKVIFVGSPGTPRDWSYFDTIRELIVSSDVDDIVEFTGNIFANNIPTVYAGADIAVNMTPTGGVDKSVLESMAAGVPVFSSNQAFKDYFGVYSDRLLFKEGDSNDLAAKIKDLFDRGDLEAVGQYLKLIVKGKSDLPNLIGKIAERIKV